MFYNKVALLRRMIIKHDKCLDQVKTILHNYNGTRPRDLPNKRFDISYGIAMIRRRVAIRPKKGEMPMALSHSSFKASMI